MVGAVRLIIAALTVLVVAACSQSDSDNVMAASGNALTPAQVDLALGPELANTAGNAGNAGNMGNVMDSPNEAAASASENEVEAADTEDALDETVPDETESEPPATNNGLEQ